VPEPLVVTFVDGRYLPLLQPWVRRLTHLGVSRTRIYCLDAQALDWCSAEGVDAERLQWSGDLRELWVCRIQVFSELLSRGEHLVHSDVDAIWVRNPLKTGSAVGRQEDLLFSPGTVWPPDVHAQWGFVLCCGWFYARPSLAARAFFEGLEADVLATGDDQVSVNRLLAAVGVRWERRVGDYQLPFRDLAVQCWREPLRGVSATGGLSVALLPHREFQRLPEDFGDAQVKHYLTPKNCEEKIKVLRQLGLM
jgi:Nucleotide-diphospho-sugar transferase